MQGTRQTTVPGKDRLGVVSCCPPHTGTLRSLWSLHGCNKKVCPSDLSTVKSQFLQDSQGHWNVACRWGLPRL